MKRFWKYVFPGLFGLLVYTTIRVINDTVSHFRFWKRAWSINVIEMCFCIGTGYLVLYLFDKLFQRFDKRLQHNFNLKTILQELVWVVIITEVINNALVTPMAALTDDGLSWGDFA